MIDESIVGAMVKVFEGTFENDKKNNPSLQLDDIYIFSQLEKIVKFLDCDIDEDTKTEFINRIKSLYNIYQEVGIGVFEDYSHDENWYKSLETDNYFWNRYKKHLSNKGFAPKSIDVLDSTLDEIMPALGNPNVENTQFSHKGLVIGDVQSGKTSNYIGMICKAVDAGYRVVFLLTGTIESLRQQTQIRVEEGFVGFDTDEQIEVGVGMGSVVPLAFTTREKDFTKGSDNSTALLIDDTSTRPYIFVIKKNVSVLKKILKAIKSNLKRGNKKIKHAMLMIDDEADNASINTNKAENDPTQTNKIIRELLGLFDKSNYVGFTATPFANVFIDPNTNEEMENHDLFPKDFIYALSAPSNYNGAKRMFDPSDNQNDAHMLEYLDENPDLYIELEDILPSNHDKGHIVKELPTSMKDAIDRFLIVNALRDLLDNDKNTHRSMLINASRFMAVQAQLKYLVEEYIDQISKDVRQSYKLSMNNSIQNPNIARLKKMFDTDYANVDCVWDDNNQNNVLYKLNDLLNNTSNKIKAVTVNSDKNSKKLNYIDHKNGFRVIAIGSLALSRGLTLEGLMISYFYRNSTAFDILMQMGRWFGYRAGYSKFCKVYLTSTVRDFYKEIIQSTEELKSDMRRMNAKKQKPVEFGIRVRNNFYNDLRITASNKMRNVASKEITKSFFGEIFATPYLDYGDDNINNIEITKALLKSSLNKKDSNVKNIYLRDLDAKIIVEFLQKLKINIDANDNFDINQLAKFINEKFDKFDVVLVEGSGDLLQLDNEISIKPSTRKYELKEHVQSILINRSMLGRPTDTAHGLDKNTIEELKQKHNDRQRAYLQTERNPLLMIYPIIPNNPVLDESQNVSEDDKLENILYRKDIEKRKKDREFEKSLKENDVQFLIGYQIGFPKSDSMETAPNNRYVVNINANYYANNDDYEDEIEE